MTVPYGYVQFDTVNPPGPPVVARLDSVRPQRTGRPGGWTEVARRKRIATTEWDGHGLERMAVAVILDGWRTRTDMRGTYDRLLSMGAKPSGHPQPPEVRVAGNVPGTALRWVVESIDPGDAITGVHGELWRQFAVVNLLEFRPAALVVRAGTVDGRPAHYTLHTVKKGDTARKLAQLYYGNGNKWRLIGNAQNPRIRSASKKLRKGRVLRIP